MHHTNYLKYPHFVSVPSLLHLACEDNNLILPKDLRFCRSIVALARWYIYIKSIENNFDEQINRTYLITHNKHVWKYVNSGCGGSKSDVSGIKRNEMRNTIKFIVEMTASSANLKMSKTMIRTQFVIEKSRRCRHYATFYHSGMLRGVCGAPNPKP